MTLLPAYDVVTGQWSNVPMDVLALLPFDKLAKAAKALMNGAEAAKITVRVADTGQEITFYAKRSGNVGDAAGEAAQQGGKHVDELGEAAGEAGKAITNGMKVTTNEALDLADEFLGPDYKEIAPGVFRSQDGLRQVRMTDADLVPINNHAGAKHMNFETGTSVTNPNGRVTFNVNNNDHVFITD